MTYETINLTNVTNIMPIIQAVNNDTNTLLIGGFLVVLGIIVFSALSVYGVRNSLLATTGILSLLCIFMLSLGLIHMYLMTFFIILLVASIILRVFGGD